MIDVKPPPPLGKDCRMTHNLVIRSAAPADHDQWLPLWDGYNAFYGRAGETALAPAITAMTWSRIFDAYEPIHALVAERDGVLLGLAHYLFHRSTTAIAPSCYLQDLFTSPAARGQGVGKALIEALYDRAGAAGSPRVYWLTHQTNATAMRLYDQVAENSGFVVYRKLL
jgi:GNAT superfamily N-acetyltransferase